MSQFQFERYEAFGWIVHRKMLAAGDRFEVRSRTGMTLENASDFAVWTQGRVIVERMETGERLPDRLPGSSILRRGATQAGDFLCKAAEPSEFWCLNRVANRHRRPNLALLDAESGQVLRLVGNTMLCGGRVRVRGRELEAPQALRKDTEVEVLDRALGFIFME